MTKVLLEGVGCQDQWYILFFSRMLVLQEAIRINRLMIRSFLLDNLLCRWKMTKDFSSHQSSEWVVCSESLSP